MMSSFTRAEKITLTSVALSCFALHLITNLNGAYGFFRDELYYIACSDHLAIGYVDQPPFSLFLLKLSRIIFGDSLTAIRIIPTLMHTGIIVITGLMVKELGGKLFAIFIASLAVALSPIHLATGSIYSMNSIDGLIWALHHEALLTSPPLATTGTDNWPPRRAAAAHCTMKHCRPRHRWRRRARTTGLPGGPPQHAAP